MVSAEAESFGLQRKLKFYWKSAAQNMQKLKCIHLTEEKNMGTDFLRVCNCLQEGEYITNPAEVWGTT